MPLLPLSPQGGERGCARFRIDEPEKALLVSYQIRLIPSGWRIWPSLKRRAGLLIRSPL